MFPIVLYIIGKMLSNFHMQMLQCMWKHCFKLLQEMSVAFIHYAKVFPKWSVFVSYSLPGNLLGNK